MKIKASGIIIKSDNSETTIDSLEFEGDFKELEAANQLLNGTILTPPKIELAKSLSERERMHYSNGEIITLQDIIKILPSENCVTNADTIKYDEKIDGKECIIIGMSKLTNELLVKESKVVGSALFYQFKIHASWVIKLSQNKTFPGK